MSELLIAVPWAGHSKDYVAEKFMEMADVCFAGHDVIFFVDEYGKTGGRYEEHLLRREVTFWCTDVVLEGRELGRDFAIAGGYEHMMWQGIDCLFASKADFDRLWSVAHNHPFVGALVAGRNRPWYPVCRSYTQDKGGYTTAQKELDWSKIELGDIISVPGYIGSDATIIHRSVFNYVDMSGYIPWEDGHTDDPLHVGPEEWFTYRMLQDFDVIPVCDTGVRPFHVHETGHAGRFPGEETTLDRLHWK